MAPYLLTRSIRVVEAVVMLYEKNITAELCWEEQMPAVFEMLASSLGDSRLECS